MPVIDTYTRFGGVHPETASLTNVLAASGVRNPLTGQPFTEAMLFGIGGGLGAGYILFEFQEFKVLVLGFHHLWQYPMRYYQNLCDHIGVTIAMPETGGRKAAVETLEKSLAKDRPVVAWMDRAYLPYLQMPEGMQGHLGHFVAVCGKDGDSYLIDDRAAKPFSVSADTFNDGRARIGSYKNRLLMVEDFQEVDVVSAVNQGLQATVKHLSSTSDSFGLPAFRKWGKMMTDPKNKKGWLVAFQDGRGLYGTLRSMFESIARDIGTGALRGLYADFLREAADVTGNSNLRDVAAQYDWLGELWLRLAHSALPYGVEPFHETQSLLAQRHALLMRGGDSWEATRPLTEQLRTLSRALNVIFPLDDAGKKELFTNLQSRILAIYEAEVQAVAALKEAL